MPKAIMKTKTEPEDKTEDERKSERKSLRYMVYCFKTYP